MFAALVLNVVQFRSIDAAARHNFRALHAYDTGDVFEIAIARDNSARRWVAPFRFYGELFPGSTIVMPRDGINSWFPFESSMVAFGKVAEVRKADYDPESIVHLPPLEPYRLPVESFAPSAGSTLRVVDERVSYFVSDGGGDTFIVVTPNGSPGRDGHLAFVDAALLPADVVPGGLQP